MMKRVTFRKENIAGLAEASNLASTCASAYMRAEPGV